MNTIKLTFVSLLCAGIFSSCRTSTSPNGGGGTPLAAANPGSTFHFTTVQTDQSGNVINTVHTTDSIVAVGISWQGRSNVIEMRSWDDQGGSGTGYYSLLSNGDVDLYLGPLAPGIVTQWLTLPYSSGGPVNTTIEDQTNSSGGMSERVVETASYRSATDTSALVQGTSLQLKEVVGTYTETESLNGQVVSTTQLPPYRYYWSTSIGFAAGAQYSTTDLFGDTVYGTQVLTGYTVK